MNDNTDGNLAALKIYEDRIDKQETCLDYLMTKIKPLLDDIEDLVSECYAENEGLEFDFSDEIKQELEEVIKR